MTPSHPVYSVVHNAATTNITTAGIEIAQTDVVTASMIQASNSTGQVIIISVNDDDVMAIAPNTNQTVYCPVSTKHSIKARAGAANATTGILALVFIRG